MYEKSTTNFVSCGSEDASLGSVLRGLLRKMAWQGNCYIWFRLTAKEKPNVYNSLHRRSVHFGRFWRGGLCWLGLLGGLMKRNTLKSLVEIAHDRMLRASEEINRCIPDSPEFEAAFNEYLLQRDFYNYNKACLAVAGGKN